MIHLIMGSATLTAMSPKNKKLFIMISCSILLIFASVRYGYGNDYFSYFQSFQNIHNNCSNEFRNQIIFYQLNRIIPNFYILIIIASILTIIPVYRLILRWVDVEVMGIAVFVYCINPYLYLMSLSSIRQALATSFFIFAVFFSYRRKPIAYVGSIIVASLFHASAIILLPFYFIANERKFRKRYMYVIILVVLILLFGGNTLNKTIELVLDFFDNVNYNYYYETAISNSLRATLLSTIFFIYVAINLPYLEGTTLAVSKLYLIGCIFSILSFRLSMFTRIQMYFDIFSVVSLPMIIKYNFCHRENKFRFLINGYVFPALIFIIYILRYYSFFTNSLWEPFFHYHTILEVI